MLTKAKEPADPNYDASDLAGRVQQNFADVADLLISIIIDVPPTSLEVPPAASCGDCGRCRPGFHSFRRRGGGI
jgi:hypothetical protein